MITVIMTSITIMVIGNKTSCLPRDACGEGGSTRHLEVQAWGREVPVMAGLLACSLELCDCRCQGIHSRALQPGGVILSPKQSSEVAEPGLSVCPASLWVRRPLPRFPHRAKWLQGLRLCAHTPRCGKDGGGKAEAMVPLRDFP